MNASAEAGRQFEDHVVETITRAQWSIHGRNIVVDGIEVDIVATYPGDSRPWFIECKGGRLPGRSGLARTDTTKKAIGAAWGLRRSQWIAEGIYFAVTTDLPRPGSLARDLLTEAVDEHLLHGVGTVPDLLAYADFLAGRLVHGGFATPAERRPRPT